MRFVPKAKAELSVTLPGEIVRAVVTKVIDAHTVIVELPQPMMRSHSFRMGDLVACRRTAGLLGETWEAIEERRTAPDPALFAKRPDAGVAGEPAKRPARGKPS